jgi:hypothetical protein
MIRSIAGQESDSGVQGLGFQLKAGGVVAAPRTKRSDASFSQSAIRYHIRSFGEAATGPVEIGLAGLKKSNVPGNWIYQDRSFDVSRAKLTINVFAGKDVLRLAPYLRDGNFFIRSAKPDFRGEVFVVRKMDVVAAIAGTVDAGAAADLRTILEGDFVFRGDRSAFFDSRNKTSDDLRNWVDSLNSSGGQVYVMKSNQLFPISKSFLQMKDQVLQFIGDNAPYVFSQKVTLLDVRPGL